MGVKRSFQRHREQSLLRTLKRDFIPARGQVDVTCGSCGKSVPVVVQALPKKKGVAITARAVCPCGNPVSVTVTGSGRPPAPPG
jgi:hypothetical protein